MKNRLFIGSLGGFLILLLGGVFIANISCKKKSTNPVNSCLNQLCPAIAIALPSVHFQILDKTTGYNLIYGPQAKFSLSQIKFTHLINGKLDTNVFKTGDTATKSIAFSTLTNHRTDTILMNIPGYSQDTFLFNTANLGSTCCPLIGLVSVNYNGNSFCNPCSYSFIGSISK